MKTRHQPKSTKLSIEIFNPKLLKETKLLISDEYYDETDSDFDEQDALEEGISEISLIEFEKTLN